MYIFRVEMLVGNERLGGSELPKLSMKKVLKSRRRIYFVALTIQMDLKTQLFSEPFHDLSPNNISEIKVFVDLLCCVSLSIVFRE